MATAYQINVPVGDTGLLGVKQTESSASKVSELLQKDLETHHVFFNTSGFHNHASSTHPRGPSARLYAPKH
jgi:hypothetical protein